MNSAFVGGGFIAADVSSDNDALVLRTANSCCGSLSTSVVEAHAVDEGLVFGQAKHARLWVAWLGPRSHRADFEVAESEGLPGSERYCVFVHSRSKAQRMLKF